MWVINIWGHHQLARAQHVVFCPLAPALLRCQRAQIVVCAQDKAAHPETVPCDAAGQIGIYGYWGTGISERETVKYGGQ